MNEKAASAAFLLLYILIGKSNKS